jgi:NADH:ubiquinone oxidoreductase subunit 5 (subunit L)/multisubunit Na+/H+ antiporter MnhA subunit
MITLIIFISLLIHLYALAYMDGDLFYLKFLSYLSLFTLFMLIFVSASNFCLMFLGWEGVGISSYLLINYWDSRNKANKAAMKAIIVNKFSDFFLYFALLLIFLNFKTLDYITLFSTVKLLSCNNSMICLGILVGAVGKSAQIGLHTWLPDAMEGPTPVSALLHAATMVTAGIFLLIKCSLFFEYAPELLLLAAFIGGLTTFLAGSIGCFTNDIKRIIAFSTCSQLGLMFLIYGCSNSVLSFFHL